MQKKQMFSIEVTDKGIGINELDMKNLFSPFFKTSDSISREKNKQSHLRANVEQDQGMGQMFLWPVSI